MIEFIYKNFKIIKIAHKLFYETNEIQIEVKIIVHKIFIKKMTIIFILTFLSVLHGMQQTCDSPQKGNKDIVQFVLSEKLMIMQMAYGIIDRDDVNDHNMHKKVLKNLFNFSLTNKFIHQVLYDLRCKEDKNAEEFNDCLIIQINKSFLIQKKHNPECLAAAYVATPHALKRVLQNHYYVDYVGKKSKKRALNLFQKKLDQQSKCVTRYIEHLTDYEGPLNAPFSVDYYTSFVEELVETTVLESFDETLAKFPKSTQLFCKKLINHR